MNESAGLLPSSSLLYCGDGCESPAFSFCTVLNPFTTHNVVEEDAAVERSPVVCLCCGGYLNRFCSLAADGSGRWTCCLCRGDNPPIFSSTNIVTNAETQKLYPELCVGHVDYIEPSDALTQASTSSDFLNGGFTYLLAIDASICRDQGFAGLLEHTLRSMPQGSFVSLVVLCGASSHVVRLVAGEGPISTDAVPTDDGAGNFLSLFVRSGVHVVPLSKVLERLVPLSAALKMICHRRRGGRDASNAPVGATLASLVGLAVVLSLSRPLGPGTRLIILSSHALSTGVLSLSSLHLIDRLRTVSGAAVVGAGAAQKHRLPGCWVDIFLLASHSLQQLARLDAFASATGGFVVRAASLDDVGWRSSLSSAVARPPIDFAMKGTPVTVEMRSSILLSIDHVVGPVLSEDEYYRITGRLLHAELADAGHVKTTLEGAKRNMKYIDRQIAGSSAIPFALLSQPESGGAKEQWSTKGYFDAIGVSGLINRVTSLAVDSSNKQKTIDVLVDTADDIIAGIRKISTSSTAIYALGRADPRCALTAQLSLNRPKLSGKNQEKPEFAFFQYVVRMVGLSPYERSRYERRIADECRNNKTTRVWTICIPLTYDIPAFLQSFDERVWAVSTGRSLAADLHAATLCSIGVGTLPGAPPAQEQESPASLRLEFASQVDRLVGDIVKYWYVGSFNFDQSSTAKIVSTCKLLYLLREGPCLAGQVMDVQEAYLVRAYFLGCSLRHALLIMAPKLYIYFPSPPPAAVTGIMRESNAPPVCVYENDLPSPMAFFPSTCVMLDAGDAIYVWIAAETDQQRRGCVEAHNAPPGAWTSEACAYITDLSYALAGDRYPVSAVRVVTQIPAASSLSFEERFIFSRLQPGQNDFREIQLYSLAAMSSDLEARGVSGQAVSHFLSNVSSTLLDNMQARAPPTDEPSFMAYMSKHAPKLFSYIRNQGKGHLVKFPQLLDMCPRPLDSVAAPRAVTAMDRAAAGPPPPQDMSILDNKL